MQAHRARPLFSTLGGGIVLAAVIVLLLLGALAIMVDNAYVYGESDPDEGLVGWSLVGAAVLLVAARVGCVVWANHRDRLSTFGRPDWRGAGAAVISVVIGFTTFTLAVIVVRNVIDSAFVAFVAGIGAAVASTIFVRNRLLGRR